MPNTLPSGSSTAGSRQVVPRTPAGRLPRVALALATLLAATGMVADLAGQSIGLPSAPSQVRIIYDNGPAPFAGTTIHVSTSGSDTNAGTQSSPVRTIQRGVTLANQLNASGQAARVLIAAGVYRESVDLTGQKTDAALVIEGAGNQTILSGADVWTAWTSQSDGSLVHHWPHKWGVKALPNGWDGYWNTLGPEREILRRSEMVYANGQPLRGVLTLSSLTAGTFFVDETTQRLHVRLPSGMSLAQTTLEVGTRLTPLSINGRRNVTLRRFAVMRSRGAVQDTAFRLTNSQNITLEEMTVRWHAYSGFGGAFNQTVRVRQSVFNDNGVLALSQLRDVDVLIEDTEIARNNWRGAAVGHRGWDSVHKWSGVRDGTVRRSRFVDNLGNGFWLDTDNKRIVLENSLVSGHVIAGVSLENNQGPITVAGNRICNNARGVQDAQSDRITLRGNQIWGSSEWNIIFTGTYSGQSMKDWETGQTVTNKGLHWTLDGNTVVGSGNAGWLWWHTDFNAPGAWAQIRNTMVLADNNVWHHSGRTTAFRLPQGAVTHTTFRSDLQLANVQHERNSVWQAPSGLTCQ